MSLKDRRSPAASPAWLRPLVTAAPWITVVLLVVMFALLDGALTISPGIVFDLPESDGESGGRADLVSLAMPAAGGTFVFFDDARYSVDDEMSLASFRDQLSRGFSRTELKTLLVLADRSISAGSLVKIAETARRAGAKKVLFAEKRPEVRE